MVTGWNVLISLSTAVEIQLYLSKNFLNFTLIVEFKWFNTLIVVNFTILLINLLIHLSILGMMSV
jgi:hypothetical protein